MEPKSYLLQRQIIENSKSITSYYEDLVNWAKEVNKKDKIINSQNIQKFNQNQKKIIKNEEIFGKENISEKSNKLNKKLKRDTNSIGDYYKEWDNIDVEEELEDRETKITINNDSMTQQLTNPKPSAAKANINVVIKNNRIGVASGSHLEEYIEKLKTEANAYFAIGNYNKSLELNIAALKFIEKEENITQENINENLSSSLISLIIALYNNKGNCHLKLNNLKEAIKDFDIVMKNDKSNFKASFRRGHCYFNLKNFVQALKDFDIASKLCPSTTEKVIIDEFVTKSILEVNNSISSQKRKMEKYEHSDSVTLRKIKINEIRLEDLDKVKTNEKFKNMFLKSYLSGLIGVNGNQQKYNFDENSNLNHMQTPQTTASYSNPKSTSTNKNTIEYSNNIIKSEDIVKFVYDITRENLTSSSFKYAFRNFKDNSKEKEEYLLKINPTYLPKVFVNDLDKDILLDLLECLKGIVKREDKR